MAAVLEARYTIPSASQGDTDAQADANDSLGGWVSTSVIPDATMNNLFRNVMKAEAETGGALYRSYAYINEGDQDAEDLRLYIESQIAGGANASIGLDPAGVVAGDSMTVQGEIVADEETVPDGVTFSAPGSVESGLEPGVVQPGEAFLVWVRLSWGENVEAQTLDNAVILCVGGTEA